VSLPVEQLRGFERVALEAGQKKTVSFTLRPQAFRFLDGDMHWVIAPGTFDLMIGESSSNIAMQGTLEVVR